MSAGMTMLVDTNKVPELFTTLAKAAPEAAKLAVYRAGALYRTRVRAKASGRPGPRVQTGNYRRSISQINTEDESGAVAIVQTNAPQARRLEYGFTGKDALGRVFNQEPRAHWGPAMEGIQDDLLAQMQLALSGQFDKIWKGFSL